MIKIEFKTCRSGKIYTDDTFIYFDYVNEDKDEIFYAKFFEKEIIRSNSLQEVIEHCNQILENDTLKHKLKSGQL